MLYTLAGGAGVDNLTGGTGNDIITGAAGNDIIKGGTGNDTITGGADNDSLTGDGGNDTFNVDAGSDTIADLATNDDLVVSSGATATANNVSAFVADSDTTNAGTATINAASGGSTITMTDSASGAIYLSRWSWCR